MIRCLHCHAETSNGLALCDLCQRKARTIFEFLPIYFRNLARWRPGRAGSRPVPGSRVLYDGELRQSGTGDRISDRLDEAVSALVTWARMLTDDRGVEPPTADTEAEQVAALCRWFDEHLISIATLDWCGEFLRDDHRDGEEFDGIGYHERRMRVLTEQLVPGWYAGECRRRVSMESTCGAPTFVVPGLTWVKCGRCGARTHAADHLDVILEEARGWVARPKVIAGALVALIDTEQSIPRLHDRIRKWESLGWLEPLRRVDRDGDPVGPKRYRLGDVLDLTLGHAEAPTRPKRMQTA